MNAKWNQKAEAFNPVCLFEWFFGERKGEGDDTSYQEDPLYDGSFEEFGARLSGECGGTRSDADHKTRLCHSSAKGGA